MLSAFAIPRKRSLLLVVVLLLLLPVFLVATVLWRAFTDQIENSYEKRLVTSLGVLELALERSVSDFRSSLSRLAADNTIQITVDLDIRPQLKRYLASQFEISDYRFLRVTDLSGAALVTVGDMQAAATACRYTDDNPTESVALKDAELLVVRSLPLLSKQRPLGYLCGGFALNGEMAVQPVVDRIDGVAQLRLKDQAVAYGRGVILPEANWSLGEVFRKEVGEVEYLGMGSEWELDGETLTLQVLVDMKQYQVLFQRSIKVIGVVALAIFVIAAFALKALGMRHRAEVDLQTEREKAVVTLESIADGVITLDTLGGINYANAAAQRMLAQTAGALVGKHWRDVFSLQSESITGHVFDLEDHLRDKASDAIADPVLVAHDGSERAVHFSAAAIHHEGDYAGAVITFRDVHKERELRRRLAWKASRDDLTGLLNRSEFRRNVEAVIEKIDDDLTHHCLLYIDLDEFKVVNDTCGHKAGDQLLRQVSASLITQLRETDVIARLGGDEFGVLLQNCPLERGVSLAKDLVELVHDTRFNFDDKPFHVGASIGLVSVNSHTKNLEDLMASVDAACYAAKEEGRNRVFVGQVDSEKISYRMEELRQASHIRHALKENRLMLFQQPIVSLVDARTVVHSEVLVRMVDEQGALVVPGAFIPVAERHGLMQEVDRWIINHLFELEGDRLRAWKAPINAAKSRGGFVYTINLSGASLTDSNFLQFVQDQLRKHRIPGGAIAFEITETQVITHLDRAAELIRSLKELGCSFLLDDFGSGMSSFGYLKRLPVDYLKIDGSFVKDIVTDPIDRSMVNMINEIGHIMGLATVAEYVENEEILELLRGIGVDMAQGYGIAEPRPLEDNPLLRHRNLA